MTSDPHAELRGRIQARLDSLTKPRGSLGLLEDIALRYALIRGEELPPFPRKAMYIFCGDHGITEERVSAYPQEVTRQMVMNFQRGGAAINVLCRQFDIKPVIVDAGVKGEAIAGAIDRKVASGTANFARGPAMTIEQAEASIAVGRELAEDAATSYDLVGLGEMGIGNTTSAAALLSVYAGKSPAETAGPGTGLNPAGVAHKAAVIQRALKLHTIDPLNGLAALSAVGGFEIGALAGFLLGASEIRLPVVLDGFISCAAALVARSLSPTALSTAFFSHCSGEPGHAPLLEHLDASPTLNFHMRLGEGTGAALMMNIIESAVRLYREMATFSEAQVSEGPAPLE